ncbi:MAG: hypothetical protein V3T23_03130 [Nitrososphaerales archaeon]
MGVASLSLSGPARINGIRVNAPVTGKEFYVSSGTGGTSSRNGEDPNFPFSTLALALDAGRASLDDTIYLMPGHVESIGNAQIAIDVVGMNIVGLGHGASRPRFDYDNAASSIDVTASDCTIRNITIRPSVTDVLVGIDVNTLVLNTLIEDVEALPGEDGAGVDDFALVVDLKVGVTSTVIRRLKVRQHASGAGYIAGIRLTGASDDVLIEGCDIDLLGAGLIAPINGLTTLSTKLRIRDCLLTTDAEPGIELLTGTTGSIEYVNIFADLATIDAATVADGMAHFECYYVEVGNEAGTLIKTPSVDD